VNEDHRFVWAEASLTDMVEKTNEPLAGARRIEQNRFGSSQQKVRASFFCNPSCFIVNMCDFYTDCARTVQLFNEIKDLLLVAKVNPRYVWLILMSFAQTENC